MRLSTRFSPAALTSVALMIGAAMPPHVLAASSGSAPTQWSVQVETVAPGNVNIEPAFTIAIYENLLQELSKTKQFTQVLRSGDRSATAVPYLLILKTTVESFTEGSETRRAATTITGATKVQVRSVLCTRQGEIVLDRKLNGSVRFFGGNLRATGDVARDVAKAIKMSALSEPGRSAPNTRSEPNTPKSEGHDTNTL